MANRRVNFVVVDIFWSGAKLMFGFVCLGMWMLAAYEINNAVEVTNQNFYERGGSELTGWDRKTEFLGYLGYGYVWGDNLYWKNTYEDCVEYSAHGCSGDTTPVEFMKINLQNNFEDFLLTYMVHAGILFMLTFYFFMRKPRGVVFNQDIGAIYTWHRGKLWILPATDFSYRYREEVNFMVGRVGNGFMQLNLHSAKNPSKTRKFKMGVFPYPCDKYGVKLAEALEVYLHRNDQDTSYIPLASTYRWWERPLFGRKKLPKDIHEQAAAWMRNHVQLSS